MSCIFDEILILGCFCNANFTLASGVHWNFIYLLIYLLLPFFFGIHPMVTYIENNSINKIIFPKGMYYFSIK